MSKLPEAVLHIQDEDSWEAEMIAFSKTLEVLGERPWFEVRWPAPVKLSQEEAADWMIRQNDTYDAVEVIDGVIHTLPPYAEILGENS